MLSATILNDQDANDLLIKWEQIKKVDFTKLSIIEQWKYIQLKAFALRWENTKSRKALPSCLKH